MNFKKSLIIALFSMGVLNTAFAETNEEIFDRAVQYYRQQNYTQALPLFQDLAEKGSSRAQVNLGLMYNAGLGIAKDDSQAAYWYQKAAKQGSRTAQFLIGQMYEVGEGVAKNETQAFYWYQKAAAQGEPHAQFTLGIAHILGRKVKVDFKKAKKYLKLSCDQGIKDACEELENFK